LQLTSIEGGAEATTEYGLCVRDREIWFYESNIRSFPRIPRCSIIRGANSLKPIIDTLGLFLFSTLLIQPQPPAVRFVREVLEVLVPRLV
jgi:hypothetical protein